MTQTAPETEALIERLTGHNEYLVNLALSIPVGVSPVAPRASALAADVKAAANALQALSDKVAELEGTLLIIRAAQKDDFTRAETAEAQVTTLTEAVEREREECAKVCDDEADRRYANSRAAEKGDTSWGTNLMEVSVVQDHKSITARNLAAAIRTRTHTERKGP